MPFLLRPNRAVRLRVIVITILGLLFAQWSAAVYSCPNLSAQVEQAAVMPPDCTDHADLPAVDRAACQNHCAADEQATNVPVVFAATAGPPSAWVLFVRHLRDVSGIVPRDWRAHGLAPPLTVLYCVSLT
ncbi:MAG TPA: hypothetical protein VFR86_11040 [Burkholderiaceae bacterium]|nr:hypothetical protein [Burkholderiaceae bacterium]